MFVLKGDIYKQTDENVDKEFHTKKYVMQRKGKRETDRQIDRQIDIQIYIQKDRQIDRQIDRQWDKYGPCHCAGRQS